VLGLVQTLWQLEGMLGPLEGMLGPLEGLQGPLEGLQGPLGVGAVLVVVVATPGMPKWLAGVSGH